MNLEEIPDSGTESSPKEEEDLPKQSVVKKWMMVLHKKEAVLQMGKKASQNITN